MSVFMNNIGKEHKIQQEIGREIKQNRKIQTAPSLRKILNCKISYK